MKPSLRRAGYVEKDLRVGAVTIHYAEGPDNGVPLLLIPGQIMCWESYVKVLPTLARRFHVVAVDIRGHGQSSRTPGAYQFTKIGGDLAALLDHVGQPAIVSGNSSGGLLAVYLAAAYPDKVLGIVPEDPPLFSSEWPRMRDATFVYTFAQLVIRHLGNPAGRDIAAIFAELEIPVAGSTRILKLPRLVSRLLALLVRRYERGQSGGVVEIGFLPDQLRVLIKSLSQYDPEFARQCFSGHGIDFDHAATLAQVRCPMLLLHANWFVHPTHGLVGAMTDADAARARALVPHCEYASEPSGHVIHVEQPRTFIRHIESFARRNAATIGARSTSTVASRRCGRGRRR